MGFNKIEFNDIQASRSGSVKFMESLINSNSETNEVRDALHNAKMNLARDEWDDSCHGKERSKQLQHGEVVTISVRYSRMLVYVVGWKQLIDEPPADFKARSDVTQ